MRLNLGKTFKFLDERWVECPFIELDDGKRLLFRIARIGIKGYQDSIASAKEKTEAALAPTTGAFIDAATKANMLASARNLKGKAAEDFALKKTEEMLERAPAPDSSAATEAFFGVLDDSEHISAHLIRDIQNLETEAGEPVTYAKKVGMDLLGKSIPFGIEFTDGDLELTEGMTLGEALRLWVLHEAAKREAFRDEYKEAAAKN